MIQKVREHIRKIPLIRRLVAFNIVPSGLFDSYIKNKPLSKEWQSRINLVSACPDNKRIPRCKRAGEIINGKQLMHNGIKIGLGSYYGPEMAQLIYQNLGVHEPEEEYAFSEVLKYIPENGLMIELGAYWGFYSLWFNYTIKGGRNILVEGDKFNLESGKRNFKLNKRQASFLNYYISNHEGAINDIPSISIDKLVTEQNIKKLDILHADIDGYELEMLKSGKRSLENHIIDYIFISTHTDDLHAACLSFLSGIGYDILCESNKDTTYSEDGLIVSKSPKVYYPSSIVISKNLHDN